MSKTTKTLVVADMRISNLHSTLPEGYCWRLHETTDPQVVGIERGKDGAVVLCRLSPIADLCSETELTELLTQTFHAVATRGF